jgi:2-haloalkanoic acid dehalogenase type II
VAPRFRVSHILLDVDGTLVDYAQAARPAFEAAAARAMRYTSSAVTALDVYYSRRAVEEEAAWATEPVHRIRHESVRRVLDAHGVAAEPAIRDVLDAYEEARDRHLTIYPDVPDGLAALATAGMTLVAASNGNVNLERVGLAQHITSTHYAEEVGFSKPDPRFFALALERLGIEPHSALVVGDRYDNDYAPAIASGLQAVLVDRPGDFAASTDIIRVSALIEIASMIEPL